MNVAENNTATGAGALSAPQQATSTRKNGAVALFNNTEVTFNTAIGFDAP